MDENLAVSNAESRTSASARRNRIQDLKQFFEGFWPTSWRKLAENEIAKDYEQVDAIAAVFPQLEIATRNVKAVLGRMLPLRERQHMIRQLGKRFAFLLSAAVIVTAPLLTALALHTPVPDAASYIFSYPIGVIAALFVAYVPFWLRQKLGFSAEISLGATAVVLCGYVTLVFSTYWAWKGHAIPPWVTWPEASLSATVVLMCILFAWAFVTVGWGRIVLERSWNQANPDVSVVSELVQTLDLLTPKQRADFREAPLHFYGRLWQRLERAADVVQRGLPSLLSPLDPENAAAQEMAQRIAAGLRDLKEDVACFLSRSNSSDREGALRQIIHSLDTWAAGAIDELPVGTPQPVISRSKPRPLMLRRILAAIAPLVVLLLVRLSPLRSPEISSALTTFSVLWLISALLRGLLGDEFEKNLESTTKLSGLDKSDSQH